MPGIREKRRRQFLADLFSRWPYRGTERVLRNARQLAQSFGLPEPKDGPSEEFFA